MINVPYTENENCYIISNFANSNNPLFTNQAEVNDFKERVFLHIGTLVEILSFGFHSDHFQMVILLRDRKTFEDYYRDKKGNPNLDKLEIPDSTYILSQEMANIQSGYAKMFNYKYKRFGSLFGRRYTRILLETSEEVESAVEEMNSGREIWTFEKIWSYIYNFMREQLGENRLMETTKVVYEGGCEALKHIFPGFLHIKNWHLRGRYTPIRLKC